MLLLTMMKTPLRILLTVIQPRTTRDTVDNNTGAIRRLWLTMIHADSIRYTVDNDTVLCMLMLPSLQISPGILLTMSLGYTHAHADNNADSIQDTVDNDPSITLATVATITGST